MLMLDAGFAKSLSHRAKAMTLVKSLGMNLGVQKDRLSALILGLSDHRMQELAAHASVPKGRSNSHTSDLARRSQAHAAERLTPTVPSQQMVREVIQLI